MIGSILDGRYQILSELGAGGMGEVYLVEHLNLARKEALKILRPDLAGAMQFVARFRREARAVNRVQHPNIVGVYDFGKLPDGRFFLSMEYVEGKSVRELIDRGAPFSIARALRVLMQLAEAVEHAHTHGVLHRDLKPDNLMLLERHGQEDFLKVLDFGIAKIIAPDYESAGLTKKGEIFGTVQYMAPELFMGTNADPRSDLYAIGCIAFELLSGEPVFSGHTMEVASAQISRSPDRLSQRRPDLNIPPALDALIARCLEKQLDRRVQSAKELMAELRGLPGQDRRAVGGGVATRAHRRGSDYDEDEVEKTSTTGQDGALADDAAFEGSSATTSMSTADINSALQQALRTLGERLLDRGHTGHTLLIRMTRAREAEDAVMLCDVESLALETRTEELVRVERGREQSLRFAISELRFVEQQARDEGRGVADLQEQIEELESRLTAVRTALDEQLATLHNAGIALASSRAESEHARDVAYDELEEVIDAAAPAYAEHADVRAYVSSMNSFRAMRKAVVAPR